MGVYLRTAAYSGLSSKIEFTRTCVIYRPLFIIVGIVHSKRDITSCSYEYFTPDRQGGLLHIRVPCRAFCAIQCLWYSCARDSKTTPSLQNTTMARLRGTCQGCVGRASGMSLRRHVSSFLCWRADPGKRSAGGNLRCRRLANLRRYSRLTLIWNCEEILCSTDLPMSSPAM